MNNIIVSEENFLKTYKHKTYGYNVLELYKKNEWLPMKSSKELAYVVGYLMGDGHLSKNPMIGTFRFYGNKNNLGIINGILKNKFNLNYYEYNLHPRRKNELYILRYNNCIFSRILELSGVPRGDKVLKPFKIPNWIVKGNKEIKSYFLRALLDCELENLRKTKNGLSGFLFQMSKIKEYENDLVLFLQQIKNLLNKFDVTTSNINVPSYRRYLRKDGKISICANFRIHTNQNNRFNLYKNISFFEPFKQKALYNSLYR